MRGADEVSGQAQPTCVNALVERTHPIVVPAWVLAFLRLRAAAGGDPAQAWASLPEALPAGTSMPSLDEAAAVLMVHGVMR